MESFAKLNFLDRNVLILEYSVKECHQMIQSRHQAKKDCYIVDQGRPDRVRTLGRSIRSGHRIRFDYRIGFGNGSVMSQLEIEKLNWTNFIWYRSLIERDQELDFVSVWPLFESGNLFQFKDGFLVRYFGLFLRFKNINNPDFLKFKANFI